MGTRACTHPCTVDCVAECSAVQSNPRLSNVAQRNLIQGCAAQASLVKVVCSELMQIKSYLKDVCAARTNPMQSNAPHTYTHMILFNLAHNAWAHVHAPTHAPSLASPPPPLTCARLPAGCAERLDIADERESERLRGSGASADREGRAD